MTPSEPKRAQDLALAAEIERAEGHLRLLRGGKDPEPEPQPRQLSRAERRAQAAFMRKQHNRALQHECVLQRDCVAAGVAIEVDPREYHQLHLSRGEHRCDACPTCQERVRQGLPAQRLTDGVRDATAAAWHARIRWHQHAQGIACLLSFLGGYGTQAKNVETVVPDT
jgi:hypothetical protein